MKKILILVLTAVASLGLTFGTALAFSADETYISDLDELLGYTITFTDFPEEPAYFFGVVVNFVSDDTEYNSISVNIGKALDITYSNTLTAYDGADEGWNKAEYKTLSFTGDTITIDPTSDPGVTEQFIVNWFNASIESYEPTPEPTPAPTMWQAILSGIGGFFSGMFSVLSGLFSGVVAVFYTNNTTTIILQALIFAAAAGLVAAAVYVIVRLIKSAIARLRGGVGGAGGYYINDKRVSRFAFKRNILKNEGRLALRSWKSGNRRYRRLLRARRK